MNVFKTKSVLCRDDCLHPYCKRDKTLFSHQLLLEDILLHILHTLFQYSSSQSPEPKPKSIKNKRSNNQLLIKIIPFALICRIIHSYYKPMFSYPHHTCGCKDHLHYGILHSPSKSFRQIFKNCLMLPIYKNSSSSSSSLTVIVPLG